MALSADERALRSRKAAHALRAKYGKELSQPARDASPGSDSYWETQVDPDGSLNPTERSRRAGHAKKAYFLGLALKSARARRKPGRTSRTRSPSKPSGRGSKPRHQGSGVNPIGTCVGDSTTRAAWTPTGWIWDPSRSSYPRAVGSDTSGGLAMAAVKQSIWGTADNSPALAASNVLPLNLPQHADEQRARSVRPSSQSTLSTTPSLDRLDHLIDRARL